MAHLASSPRLLRGLALFGLLAVLFCLLAGPATTTLRAQEPPPADGDKGDEGKAATPEKKPQVGLFTHMVNSLGITYIIIFLFMSIGLVALVVLLTMELRLGAAIPPSFVEDFTDTVNKRRFKEAYEMAREDGSFLGRVLTTGMSRLQYGIEDAREAAFNMVSSVKAGKDQLVTYLATIGTLGPMLGLVGTVWGMILSFRILELEGSANPQRLAGSIAHALVVTLVGVALSVPAIFCHAFFSNRLTRLANETAGVADDLLTQMYHNSRKPAAPEVAGAPPVPPVPANVASIKPK